MDERNFRMLVSAMTFIIGGLFVISNAPDITANVIGASGPEAGLVSIFGIVILVASGIYFMMTASLDDMIRTQRDARRSTNHSATDSIAHEYTDTEKKEYSEKKE
jgi:hypothetical protein